MTRYNTYEQTFPAVIFAAMVGHARDTPLLEFDGQQIREAPEVSL